MLSNVTCPTCKHKFPIPEGNMGQRLICPNCQSPFFAGKSVASPTLSGASPSPAIQPAYEKTMLGETSPPIKYHCPRCQAPLEAPASEAGTKKLCPACSQKLQVPNPPKPAPAPAPAPNGLNKTMLASDESSAAPGAPPIKYNCPNCKKPLEAPASQAGTKQFCPACSQKLKVPAAPSKASNLNKTMLASDDSTAPAGAAGGYPVAAGSSGTGVLPGNAPAPRLADTIPLTPRNLAIGIGVLLLLLYLVPVFIRGGKSTDEEALRRTQLELDKLKTEIEGKKADLERQQKSETEMRRQFEEMLAKSRAQEEKMNNDRLALLASINDQNKKKELEDKLKEEQRKWEQQKLEMEKNQQKLLEDNKRALEENKRALEQAQQKQQTIIQQPAPVIHYPPYDPYYWRWRPPWY